MPDVDLHGYTVVVTRPQHQAGNLCRLIEAAGGKVILFPVLVIAAPQDPQAVLAVLQRLAQFDLVVFISPNAVDYGLRYAAQVGGLPTNLQIAAVGAGTARALQAAGHPPTLVPEHDFNSEALLALAALQQVAGDTGVPAQSQAPVTFRQEFSAGETELESQLGRQVFIGYTAHPVGAE